MTTRSTLGSLAATRLRALPALAAGLIACLPHASAMAAAAAPNAASATPVKVTSAVPGATRTHTYTLKQLGALFPLQLRGIDGVYGVPFSVRADEVVTGATLRLAYAYSPALLPDLSHINVLVNGEVSSSIPVPREQGGVNLTRDIAIPPRLITEFNRLNLQLIGHYTMECEDPAHSSLWANISNNSVLELTVTRIALENDLALLPQPFFDRRDIRPLNLPFVFASAPGGAALEAAGVLSSWFGALASYRGATFPVTQNAIPDHGNAVILATANERVAGVTWPQVQGPTVAVATNPNDPYGKLLLVLGRDAAELKTAATALAVGAPTLSGQAATITGIVQQKPRKPYDAPNWLRADRAVKFGELADAAALNVSGYSPDLIRVNFRMPPDLFAWREKGIPVDLRYRYTPRAEPDKSTLNININQRFLRSEPLLAIRHDATSRVDRLLDKVMPDGTVPARAKFQIPLFMLPAQTQMQFHYYYDYIKQGECKDVVLDNVRGTIEPDSTIDISHFSHFIAMPDLAAFSNSGFPFTRMADLSDTAVVLPDSPTPADYSTYLTVLGRLGDATGYPATGVTVAAARQAETLGGKDLLVISSGGRQPLLQQWAQYMPVSLDGNAKRFSLSDKVYQLFSWRDSDSRTNAKPTRQTLAFNSASSDAIIAGFESPLSGGRSVVVISANQPAGLHEAMRAMLDPDLVKSIQGSAVVIREKQVDSLAADQTYFVGSLNPLLHVQWYLANHPLLLALLGIVAALLLAVVLYLSLRARARRRLAL
ncbi:cellulose biosynthesis cyclic di-GMP-binding regulatory protein BcsB [Pigmentiphaga sp. CHJ604]|uniref:cellulose biosynthesis cyclic di-GMP-binding regulatory protein BcsB n=1 Tax=Pigmentiphaga sp. CHJ604 TaxID=3081984 RepID=UPI0030D20360